MYATLVNGYFDPGIMPALAQKEANVTAGCYNIEQLENKRQYL